MPETPKDQDFPKLHCVDPGRLPGRSPMDDVRDAIQGTFKAEYCQEWPAPPPVVRYMPILTHAAGDFPSDKRRPFTVQAERSGRPYPKSGSWAAKLRWYEDNSEPKSPVLQFVLWLFRD